MLPVCRAQVRIQRVQKYIKRTDTPSVQPNCPRCIRTVSRLRSQRSIVALERPEEQCVIWVVRAVYRYVACEVSVQGECYVWQRILHEKI